MCDCFLDTGVVRYVLPDIKFRRAGQCADNKRVCADNNRVSNRRTGDAVAVRVTGKGVSGMNNCDCKTSKLCPGCLVVPTPGDYRVTGDGTIHLLTCKTCIHNDRRYMKHYCAFGYTCAQCGDWEPSE